MSDLYAFEQIAYPVIMAPFFGVMMPVKLRELTHAQISACGDFSLIETFEDKVQSMVKRTTTKESVDQIEIMTNVVRESLVSPKYDEILSIYDKDKKIIDARKRMKEIKEKIYLMKSGPQKSNLENELNIIRMQYEFLLPEDFIGFIWSYALGIDKSDIRKLSDKILLEAAVLAEKGHDNPADHIDGKWPEFQKGFYLSDINKRAWYLLHLKREANKPAQKIRG